MKSTASIWVIALDHSGSMRSGLHSSSTFRGRIEQSLASTKLDAAKEALLREIAGMDANANVAVMAFTTEVTTIFDGKAGQSSELRIALAQLSPGDGTNISRAIMKVESFTHSFSRVDCLVISDGLDDKDTVKQSADHVRRLGVVINAVLIDPTPDGERTARAMVGETGRVYSVASPSELNLNIENASLRAQLSHEKVVRDTGGAAPAPMAAPTQQERVAVLNAARSQHTATQLRRQTVSASVILGLLLFAAASYQGQHLIRSPNGVVSSYEAADRALRQQVDSAYELYRLAGLKQMTLSAQSSKTGGNPSPSSSTSDSCVIDPEKDLRAWVAMERVTLLLIALTSMRSQPLDMHSNAETELASEADRILQGLGDILRSASRDCVDQELVEGYRRLQSIRLVDPRIPSLASEMQAGPTSTRISGAPPQADASAIEYDAASGSFRLARAVSAPSEYLLPSVLAMAGIGTLLFASRTYRRSATNAWGSNAYPSRPGVMVVQLLLQHMADAYTPDQMRRLLYEDQEFSPILPEINWKASTVDVAESVASECLRRGLAAQLVSVLQKQRPRRSSELEEVQRLLSSTS